MQISATEIMARVAVLAGLKYAWRMNVRAIAVQTPHAEFAQNRAHWMDVQTIGAERTPWEISAKKRVDFLFMKNLTLPYLEMYMLIPKEAI